MVKHVGDHLDVVGCLVVVYLALSLPSMIWAAWCVARTLVRALQ